MNNESPSPSISRSIGTDQKFSWTSRAMRRSELWILQCVTQFLRRLEMVLEWSCGILGSAAIFTLHHLIIGFRNLCWSLTSSGWTSCSVLHEFTINLGSRLLLCRPAGQPAAELISCWWCPGSPLIIESHDSSSLSFNYSSYTNNGCHWNSIPACSFDGGASEPEDSKY